MSALRSMLAATLCCACFASCSGGGGTPRTATASPSATPAPIATASPQSNVATLSFAIADSDAAAPANRRATHVRSRSYVAPSTQKVTIAIAYPGATYPLITAEKSCDPSGANCTFAASASLPVEPNAYTFTLDAYGKSGANDLLSSGTVTQILVPGPNVVATTLGAVVSAVSLAISGGTPAPGGAATQTFPVTFKAFDPDGNLIGANEPFAFPFAISYQEIDDQGAFALQPGPSGAASCNAQNEQCALSSTGDTLEISYNAQANALPSDPAYFPAEFVIYDSTSNVLTAANSADLSTAPCTTPQPLCVFAAPYYSELLAHGGNYDAFGVGFSPTVVAPNASTIWTDAGVISSAGTVPAYTTYAANGAVASQALAALAYVPAANAAFAPDYDGDASEPSRQLDRIAANASVTTTTYPNDTNTLDGVPSGAGIIVGPDGNIWWIDPITGVLRYASPSNPTMVSTCLLQSDMQTFLTAAQIVPTPPGVTPSRIWFSAVDAIDTETYIGYVDVSAGSNSCGASQAGHYTAFDTNDEGTATPPNGLAVDGAGRAWYDEGDNRSFTNASIGQASADPNTGTVTVSASKPLPGALGKSSQAWGIVYDLLDGNMYFASDDGTIGKFNPNAGISSTTAFALPAPIANLYDVTSGPTFNDSECQIAPGPCVQQFAWDPGASAKGRLTFVIPATGNVLGVPGVTNVVVQLDLSGPGVTFAANARSRRIPGARPHLRTRRSAFR